MTETTKQTGLKTAIEALIPIDAAETQLGDLWTWVETEVLNIDTAIEFGLIGAAIIPALLFGERFRHYVRTHFESIRGGRFTDRLLDAIAILALPILVYLGLSFVSLILGATKHPHPVISSVLALILAWITVRMVTLVIRSPFWSNVAFYVIWPIAALDIFGALGPVIEQIQALSLPMGQNDEGEPIRVSLWDVLRTLFYFALLFWIAGGVSRFLQTQVDRAEDLSPTLKALVGKTLNVLLPVLAFLVALQIAGFNITTLAVFSGAIGLGIGLGLQPIVSNFTAGFTLIADESIKPGDIIEIDGTTGWVTSLRARYVALRTLDGTEHLIPNDRFISEGVVNWSRSDRLVRRHALFGISYATENLREIQQLAIQTAIDVDRVVKDPPPNCNLLEFGDSSVNFDLAYWISDPQAGIANVQSDVLLAIWEMLHEQGVEIPFPQRDLHVRSWSPDALPPGHDDA